MASPVSRAEELERSNNSVFSERQEELEAMADKMPKRLAGQFPFLMEIRTGVIHPYTESLAERSDLVIGCYNLEGSNNPEDGDPYYDPQASTMRNERRARVEKVGPANAAEAKAAAAAERGEIRRQVLAEEADRIRAEETDRIRAELLAEMAANPAPAPAPEVAPVPAPEVAPAPAPAKQKSKSTKGKAADKATADAGTGTGTEADAAATADDAGAGNNITEADDLAKAFEQAMK